MRTLFSKCAVILASLLLITACSESTNKEGATKVSGQSDAKSSISILYPSWTEGVAITNLAKVVLEENNFDVKITLIEPGPLYASLSKGDADLYLDAWLPNTHRDYWERFGDQLEIIGTVFDNGVTGLVVPSYVEINSIEELNENRALFEGKIYGIGAGAGIHTNTIKAIEEYNLDYEQITSSESSMMAALKRAVSDKTPIIITGWKPHYKWAMYDLKILEDPKNIYKTDRLEIVSRKNFSKDQPKVAKFMTNFALEEALLYELMDEVGKDDRNPEKGAKNFFDNHHEMIQDWFEA